MKEPRLDSYLNLCRWCDLEVVWVDDDKAGTRFPVDADMDTSLETGMIALSRGTDGELKAVTPSTGQAKGMRAMGIVLYAQHALTCPKAGEWHNVKEHGAANRRTRTRR